MRLATKSGSRSFVPDRGDVLWLTFDPQAGHEQAGRRPAVVLSPAMYNRSAGLALVVPITSQRKGYPFEVAIPAGLPATGVVLSDHVKSVDWRTRKAERFFTLPAEVIRQILAKTSLLFAAR